MKKYRKIYIGKIISVITSIVVILNSHASIFKVIFDELIVWAEETHICGDITVDGNIDILDMIFAKNNIVENKSVSLSSSDVNADGVFDYKDVYEFADYLTNRTSCFSGLIKTSICNINRNIVNTSNKDVNLQMTAEMAELTKKLGTPLEVYKYVLNNVNTEFYYGSRKGAVGTYEQNGGNDYDQSSLLIAMLRYLGYEANYAVAKIKLSKYDLCNITATSNIDAAKKIFTSQGRILNENNEGYYITEEVFVWLTMNNQSYPLDAGYKYYKPKEQEISFRNAYETLNLPEIDNINPYNNYVLENDVYDVFPTIEIIDQGITKLPNGVPYLLASDELSIVKEIPESQSDVVELYLGDAKLMTYNTAFLYNKNLTVEYELTEDAKFYLNDIYGYNIDSIDDLTANLGTN